VASGTKTAKVELNKGTSVVRLWFQANCHLMLTWLPELQKIIEKFEDVVGQCSFIQANPR